MSVDINTAKKKVRRTKSPTLGKEQKRWMGLLWLFAAISVISLVALAIYLSRVNEYINNVNQLELYSARIANDANKATLSQDYEISSAGYDNLQKDMQKYEQALNQVRLHALENQNMYSQLLQQWQKSKVQAQTLLDSRNNANVLQDLKDQVSEASGSIQSAYKAAAEQAGEAGVAAEQINTFQVQSDRVEKMSQAFGKMTVDPDATSDTFKSLSQEFAQTLDQQLLSMGAQIPALQEVAQIYTQMIAPIVQDISNLNNSPSAQSFTQARALNEMAVNTQKQLDIVNRNLLAHPYVMWSALGFLVGLVGMLFSLYRLYKVRGSTQQLLVESETLRQRQNMQVESERARKIQEENERNQMAILRLLDELGDLAEGDLTVNATVSEDFTGAIADSVNFAIDQLRQLVLAINTTAVRVAQSSEETQLTAVELAEASEHQAQEIAGVSAAINEMAVSIDQVSANAAESTSVAQRSVAIAHNGAEVVQRSIEGMNTIREQIQETSKRIKRLGESSQEIGDIVGLINDIADQTNVLALNAAIQASMAGEAGRGFAVVADEVQRLAERSANATKQIETLVKTIQADTNEAVMSMESTTTEVVRGARLAKDAGEALEEVQTVSNTLADLIQNISNAAQQQASSAGHISKTMNIIQDITSQTSSGTLATARSVGQLNEMAAALQESVSGFKLDETEEEIDGFS